jgi:hypothetical protein
MDASHKFEAMKYKKYLNKPVQDKKPSAMSDRQSLQISLNAIKFLRDAAELIGEADLQLRLARMDEEFEKNRQIVLKKQRDEGFAISAEWRNSQSKKSRGSLRRDRQG